VGPRTGLDNVAKRKKSLPFPSSFVSLSKTYVIFNGKNLTKFKMDHLEIV
jgi:hypothetical protein